MRVLVCDDDPTVGTFLRIRFEVEGWDVQVTSSGQECLEALAAGDTPDVLILDQEMPGLRGTDVAAQLRDDGFSRPIVLCSAHLDGYALREQARLHLIPVNKIDIAALVRIVAVAAEEASSLSLRS